MTAARTFQLSVVSAARAFQLSVVSAARTFQLSVVSAARAFQLSVVSVVRTWSAASVRARSLDRRAGPVQPQLQRASANEPRSVVVAV
ncbi:hypothetical protein [Streptomyces lateritius]|uniref:hypothetical protein n=1 Tax=Streptomyces lateritius TaxID=67313 RepID=UPI001C8BA48D|nr:hypothetical protein [Streptomyces lateritius]MBX9423900.1 hypothetical protein [Streptomyces lateritius]